MTCFPELVNMDLKIIPSEEIELVLFQISQLHLFLLLIVCLINKITCIYFDINIELLIRRVIRHTNEINLRVYSYLFAI